MKSKIIYIFLITFIIIFLIEWGLRVIVSPIEKKRLSSLDRTKLYSIYSKDELNKALPFRHKNHGGECLKEGLGKEKLNWHPRYGFYDKDVNLKCINKLFSNKTKNIVFFGGSVMANYETPNYLTSIENYAFKENFDKYRSINFATSGSRLSNELSQFIEYVPKIKNIDLVLFVDGINEFQSIRFNGEPDDDFYWTAGVNLRIHDPLNYFFDLIVDRSKIIEILAISIFDYRSSRISRNLKVNDKELGESYQDYFYRKEIIKMMCNQLKLKCLFLIHPVFYTTDGLGSKNDILVAEYIQKHYPNYKKIVDEGYQILRQDKDIIDLSKIFESKKNIFFDEAHTNKIGSEVMGKEIYNIISKNIF